MDVNEELKFLFGGSGLGGFRVDWGGGGQGGCENSKKKYGRVGSGGGGGFRVDVNGEVKFL